MKHIISRWNNDKFPTANSMSWVSFVSTFWFRADWLACWFSLSCIVDTVGIFSFFCRSLMRKRFYVFVFVWWWICSTFGSWWLWRVSNEKLCKLQLALDRPKCDNRKKKNSRKKTKSQLRKNGYTRKWCVVQLKLATHICAAEHFKRAFSAFLLILLNCSLEVKKSEKETKWTFCHLAEWKKKL